jgi:DNA-binding transcriptional MerR regulator
VSGLESLDDPRYPAYSISQAAELLGCRQAFLRSLDSHGLVSPQRSTGGHRRYSRHQLETASRVRGLLDDGYSMTAACHVVVLEDELRKARARLSDLRRRVEGHDA